MRRIIFRGIESKTGEFKFGDLLQIPNNDIIEYFILCRELIPCINETDIQITKYPVIPETVGQFTGLTDKHGKMIFEGDIVKKRIKRGIKDCIVRFDDGMFHCGYGGGSSTPGHYYTLNDSRIEIVGNIYTGDYCFNEKR